MNRNEASAVRFRSPGLFLCVALVMAILPVAATAAPAEQTVFESPERALDALIQAIESGDLDALEAIFGPGSREILSSGDEVADAEGREIFLARTDEGVAFEKTPGGQVILLIGSEDWPFPIALARQGEGWYFDTESGKQELLDRRVGRNEIHTLATCHAYVDAQREYRSEGRDGRPPAYAQKMRSAEGQHDGLYWPAVEGEIESPLGPFLAEADVQARRETSESQPFYGYHYRILTAQGANVPGGEMDYIEEGLLTGGFALVAWPAKYGNSGIMTFVVNQQGVVYQKDLGDETAALAGALTAYNPDDTWDPVLE